MVDEKSLDSLLKELEVLKEGYDEQVVNDLINLVRAEASLKFLLKHGSIGLGDIENLFRVDESNAKQVMEFLRLLLKLREIKYTDFVVMLKLKNR